MSIRDSLRDSFGLLRRLRRDSGQAWLGGVCAGIARYSGWTPTGVRVVTFLIVLFSAFWPAFTVYCLLWWLIDPDDEVAPAYADTRPYAPSSPRSDNSSSRTADARARFARLEERLRNMEECVSSKEFELRQELRRLES